MEAIKINDRLLTAVQFVREGKRLADIGTDHAYLPIYLLSGGIISSAVAADINEGPLKKAKENILKYGYENKITTALCDGLTGVDEDSVDDIAIFGMGGELIARIIEVTPWLYNLSSGKRLILQSMTHPEKLRKFLADNGFNIIGESLSLDRGRIYQTICAEYDGIKRSFDDLVLFFGEHILNDRGDLLNDLMENTLKKLKNEISGKALGGENTDLEQNLIESIEKYIKEEWNI